MAQQIRVTVESLDDTGCVISKDVVMTKVIVKPDHIVDLGFRHAEQIDLLRHVQQKLLDNWCGVSNIWCGGTRLPTHTNI